MNRFRISSAVFALGLTAALPALAAPDDAALAKRAEALVKAHVDANEFSGSVLVARDGHPVFRKGFAFADREWNIPNSPETVFLIGSISKQFAAVSILQLAEQGKLSLEDPISRYYTDAPEAWKSITIQQVLGHRSGIHNYTSLPDFAGKIDPATGAPRGGAMQRLDRTPAEIIALVHDQPLDFPPGSKYSYSNTGYVLLGYIVEKVSGENYADYLKQHIFTPMGMKNSAFDSREEILPHRASGYNFQDHHWSNATFLSMTVPHAAGSLHSTVDDLLIWDQALINHPPLKPESMKKMYTDNGDGYADGWFVSPRFGHKFIGHSGGINGFSAMFERYLDDHVTVIVLGNLSSAGTQTVADELSTLYLGVEGKKLSAAMLDRYAGSYEHEKTHFTVRRDGDHLVVERGQGQHQTLLAKTDNVFYAIGGGAEVTFQLEGDKVTGVKMGNGPIVARK